MKKRIISLLLCVAMLAGAAATFSSCAAKKSDVFVIMTEQLDGLFNPFFYTSAPDGTIVSMTQIGMLGSTYKDGKVEVAYGENEAVVVKDYEIVENDNDTTTYNFVIKNGIKFSDGQALTMEDILFNYYVYLDPVYTGSNTLYSTDIIGLNEYRTQTSGSATDDSNDLISSQATSRANARLNELINLYIAKRDASSKDEVSKDEMIKAIKSHSVSSGYKSAIANDAASVTNQNLLDDYNHALELFKKELEADFEGVKDSFTDEPYKSHKEFEDDIFCFMFAEGYVSVEYAEGADGKIDRTKIKKLTADYANIKTKEAAINYVFTDMIATSLDIVLSYTATANTLATEFAAKAKEVILHENVSDDGALVIPNISGIVSLGHTDKAGSKIKVNGTEYTIASDHNKDGTVKNAKEYDVLSITIDGVDPKAIWNFAITIAPQHYYGEGSKVGVDIKNNKFGVEYASFDFMTKVVQSTRNIKLPVGAGAYKVTDAKDSDKPGEGDFFKDNVVYFKANENFSSVGEGIENAKIGKIRYQIVSSQNAIAALENGSVHYISPALTNDNYDKLQKLDSKGMKMLTTDQLGYGYIGINSAKVNDINLRKAIMCAMNTSLALHYYRPGTADQIFWPMSKVSWAYPTGSNANDNGHEYPTSIWTEEIAKSRIESYMQEAGVSAGDSQLKIKFTIAGSSLTDHPTYKVFRDAADLLNKMDWDVEVICDTQALTKINTGALEVWAAAWSSALDPDMYQVYHKDSTATSTLAWGYNYLKTSGTEEELDILDELSELIDEARETNDQNERSKLYKEAMSCVLDLAIELPVYQRDVLYAYNSKVINADTLPKESEMNPYSSPLDRIWEIEFAK